MINYLIFCRSGSAAMPLPFSRSRALRGNAYIPNRVCHP